MKLNKKDITSKNGFPANIDKSKNIVVQMPNHIYKQGVVLYFCSLNGDESSSYLPIDTKYDHGLYIFRGGKEEQRIKEVKFMADLADSLDENY